MKMKSIIILLLLLVAGGALFAQDYYVSPSGNDGNAGTQPQPWATIQHAVDVATAGSTVYIMQGTYAGNITSQVNSGTAANPITFKNYSNDLVYIDGAGAGSGVSTLWTISDVNYLVIDGLIFRNVIGNFAMGLVVRKNCTFITVQNCKFTEIHFSENASDIPTASDNASPLILYSTSASLPCNNIFFRKNEVYNCRTGYSEGITINGNVFAFSVDGNYVHHITNIGIDVAGYKGACPDPMVDQARVGNVRGNIVHDCISAIADAGQIYIDGARDVVVENNIAYNGSIGIAANCEVNNRRSQAITIRNNICYNNSRTGIQIGNDDPPATRGKVTGSTIFGNTCYKNDTGNGWAGELNVMYAEQLTVNSNIFYAGNDNKVVFNYFANNGPGNVFNYNLYYSETGETNSLFTYGGVGHNSFAAYKAATGNDVASIFKDPKLKDPATADFHLKEASPAINAGNPSYTPNPIEVDLDGESRQVGVIDCGADESNFSTGIGVLNAEEVAIYPNPATDQLIVDLIDKHKGIVSIAVFDASGRLLQNHTLLYDGAPFTIDMKGLSDGIYFLRVAQKDKAALKRFVKR